MPKFEVEVDDEKWKTKFQKEKEEWSNELLMDNIIRSFDGGGLYPKVKEIR